MDSLSRHEDYGSEALAESHLDSDPLAQFAQWLIDAEQADIFEPNAFVLGTVDDSGKPTARTVLLKGVDERGFFFATNYSSRKGRAIESNAPVTGVFGWYPMYRQVLIEGYAERVVPSESDEYFASRPHDSQVAAWASRQSQPIESRAELENQFEAAAARFPNDPVPRPDFWGGYRIVPLRIEFWKGRSNRMHDRIEFQRDNQNQPWRVQRLQP
ncbi:pyridoxamine 5'-phosphate oxidase [Microbacteriaceae bacterium MWH-Ta3]|nr:pyridoxamine 5'-phosphate oxidase [Microbacteriaceae bacterium MWH-Ta3]